MSDPFKGLKYCKKHMYWFKVEEGCPDCKKEKGGKK